MSELWYVKLPDGDVEPLTLDDLDAAFQSGAIGSDTMVLAAGATEWAKLGELAGLEQPQPIPQPVVHRAPVAMQRAPLGPATLPSSLRPVSVDLGALDDDEVFQPKRKGGKKWVFGVALVAGVLGVAAFEAQRSGALSLGRLSVAAASQPVAPPAAPPPVVSPPLAPAPAAPVLAAAAVSPTGTPGSGNPLTDMSTRFSPEQKEKLAAADKVRDAKAKTHVKAHAGGSAPTTGSKSKSQGFTTGGSKYDPLNATIP